MTEDSIRLGRLKEKIKVRRHLASFTWKLATWGQISMFKKMTHFAYMCP